MQKSTKSDSLKENPPWISESSKKRKNCAADLNPPLPKREKPFIGLENSGATSYLNPILQFTYMIPEMRNAVMSLPLNTEENIMQPSNFPASGSSKILSALQKLFAELKALDANATSTQELTNSFVWDLQEHLVQNGFQEAYRVIFQALEHEMRGTDQKDFIKKHFEYYAQ